MLGLAFMAELNDGRSLQHPLSIYCLRIRLLLSLRPVSRCTGASVFRRLVVVLCEDLMVGHARHDASNATFILSEDVIKDDVLQGNYHNLVYAVLLIHSNDCIHESLRAQARIM